MVRLKSFFGFFGSKHRIVKHYPAPRHETVIEPFAGSAAYALLHHDKKVVLVERDPAVASVWRYLIDATEEQVLKLPLIPDAETLVSSLVPMGSPEWLLIGFNIHSGEARPRDRVSNHCRDYRPPWPHYTWKDPKTGYPYPRMEPGPDNLPRHIGYENFWGEKRRARIARQVGAIKHWQIIEGDYTEAPNVTADWFIDPPYQKAGKSYPFHEINYEALARWCKGRSGQVIVCEAEGAQWLPFETLGTFKSTPGDSRPKKSAEVIYHLEPDDDL